jgi:hypothetical protein
MLSIRRLTDDANLGTQSTRFMRIRRELVLPRTLNPSMNGCAMRKLARFLDNIPELLCN